MTPVCAPSDLGLSSSAPPPPLLPRCPTNHIDQRLCHGLPLRVPAGPVVPGSPPLLGDVDVLRVEQVAYVRILDAVDHPKVEGGGGEEGGGVLDAVDHPGQG